MDQRHRDDQQMRQARQRLAELAIQLGIVTGRADMLRAILFSGPWEAISSRAEAVSRAALTAMQLLQDLTLLLGDDVPASREPGDE